MSDDSDDFSTFFRQDYVPLIAFLRKVGFGREESEDAAAEAMTCACQSWFELQSPRAWVRVAAYRIALRQAMRYREGTVRAIAGWTPPAVDGSDQFRAVEEQERVLTLLQVLPSRQREVMAWHLDGFDNSEIAEHLGVSTMTVRSTLRHARDRLRIALQVTGRDEPVSETAEEVPGLGQ